MLTTGLAFCEAHGSAREVAETSTESKRMLECHRVESSEVRLKCVIDINMAEVRSILKSSSKVSRVNNGTLDAAADLEKSRSTTPSGRWLHNSSHESKPLFCSGAMTTALTSSQARPPHSNTLKESSASELYQAFLAPGFNANEYANLLLARDSAAAQSPSNAAANGNDALALSSDVGPAMARLNGGIDELHRRLRSQARPSLLLTFRVCDPAAYKYGLG